MNKLFLLALLGMALVACAIESGSDATTTVPSVVRNARHIRGYGSDSGSGSHEYGRGRGRHNRRHWRDFDPWWFTESDEVFDIFDGPAVPFPWFYRSPWSQPWGSNRRHHHHRGPY